MTVSPLSPTNLNDSEARLAVRRVWRGATRLVCVLSLLFFAAGMAADAVAGIALQPLRYHYAFFPFAVSACILLIGHIRSAGDPTGETYWGQIDIPLLTVTAVSQVFAILAGERFGAGALSFVTSALSFSAFLFEAVVLWVAVGYKVRGIRYGEACYRTQGDRFLTRIFLRSLATGGVFFAVYLVGALISLFRWGVPTALAFVLTGVRYALPLIGFYCLLTGWEAYDGKGVPEKQSAALIWLGLSGGLTLLSGAVAFRTRLLATGHLDETVTERLTNLSQSSTFIGWMLTVAAAVLFGYLLASRRLTLRARRTVLSLAGLTGGSLLWGQIYLTIFGYFANVNRTTVSSGLVVANTAVKLILFTAACALYALLIVQIDARGQASRALAALPIASAVAAVLADLSYEIGIGRIGYLAGYLVSELLLVAAFAAIAYRLTGPANGGAGAADDNTDAADAASFDSGDGAEPPAPQDPVV